MLIEFSVSNFRSVKEKITFSMLAEDSSTKKDESSFKTNFNMAPDLSTLSVIYGPNASGKSNLLEALIFIRSLVLNSAQKMQDGDHFETLEQFKLGREEALSEFEIVFIHEDFLFQYGFSLDKERIHDEWLYATESRAKKENTKQKSQTWISRSEGKIGIPKEKEAIKDLWLASTRSNALILSTAVQLNSEKLKLPFDWFKKQLRVLLVPEKLSPSFSLDCLETDKDSILKFMRGLDFSFQNLEVREHLVDESFLDKNSIPEEIRQKIAEDVKKSGGKIQELNSIYRVGKKTYDLDFAEESKGTRRLFAIAGPILDVLKNGYVLVVDELDTSLHPVALRGVIELFKNPKTNPKHAQLIFTTHDTSIMDLFNREQVWLVEKNKDYASELISVSDFEGRSTDIIEKKYMAGRYGALPRIGDLI
jgi:AAA15 family ATPase/GTPase